MSDKDLQIQIRDDEIKLLQEHIDMLSKQILDQYALCKEIIEDFKKTKIV